MSDSSLVTESTPDARTHAAPLEQCSHWMAFAAAVQFLTRLPLSRRPVSAAALAYSPVYFPLVGALIGALTAIALFITCQFWPVWLAVLVVLALEVQLTGALHEDAVADFCDAFGGGWTTDHVLIILKDSRLGTYGALGLGLSVALRAGATIEILNGCGREHWLAWGAALVTSSAVGRWAMVLVMVLLKPVFHRESVARDIGGPASSRQLFVATLWLLPFAAYLSVQLPMQFALALVWLGLLLVYLVRMVKHRLNGVTGDCLGCIGYFAQLVVLLAAAARWLL
jgi:adenosylcobinamide-GDP ribazoletransferase